MTRSTLYKYQTAPEKCSNAEDRQQRVNERFDGTNSGLLWKKLLPDDGFQLVSPDYSTCKKGEEHFDVHVSGKKDELAGNLIHHKHHGDVPEGWDLISQDHGKNTPMVHYIMHSRPITLTCMQKMKKSCCCASSSGNVHDEHLHYRDVTVALERPKMLRDIWNGELGFCSLQFHSELPLDHLAMGIDMEEFQKDYSYGNKCIEIILNKWCAGHLVRYAIRWKASEQRFIIWYGDEPAFCTWITSASGQKAELAWEIEPRRVGHVVKKASAPKLEWDVVLTDDRKVPLSHKQMIMGGILLLNEKESMLK